MNPWEYVLYVLGWVVLSGVLLGVFRGVKGWFVKPKPTVDPIEEFQRICTEAGKRHPTDNQKRTTFINGAVWYMEREKGKDV